MLYGFLVTLYVLVCILLIIIILIQKSKGSMGLDSIGGGAQTIFGDIYQARLYIYMKIGCDIGNVLRDNQSGNDIEDGAESLN